MQDSRTPTISNPNGLGKTGRETRPYDIFSRLLKDRIIFLGTPIDDTVANMIIAQLLFLQMEDSKKDISIYIHSPGGYVTAGMAIYDTMQFMTCDVATYCIGMAASMGAVLLAAGTKGKRFFAAQLAHHDPPAERRRARPGQRHQHPGQGNPAPQEALNDIMAYHTGQPVDRLKRTWSATII